MDDRFDVTVVGGGIAGLVAATTAARAGARVVLLDGHPLGGRARSTDRDGFRLNQGPHAVYRHGALQRVLDDLGIAVSGGAPPLRGSWLWSHGDLHRMPTGMASLVRTSAIGGRAKLGLGLLLARLPRIDASRLADRSLAEWMADERVPLEGRPLVAMLARIATYSAAPDRISADAAVAQMQLALRGVTYVDGGWQRLVDGLAAAARAAGVDVRHGPTAAAGAVERRGDGWSVATAAGEAVAPSLILAAGSPAAAASLLGYAPGLTATAGPAVHASCLDLGLRRPAPRGILFGVEDPLYLTTHAPVADLAPAGHHLVTVMRNLAPGEVPDVEATRAELWDHAARAGIADDDVVVSRYSHRLPVTHGLPVPEHGGLAGRPAVAVAEAPGLFVAGDWVGSTGMLADAAAASATVAAGLAVRQALAVGT